MKHDDRDLAYLWDMRKAARDARDLLRDVSFEKLDEDRIRKLALERALEVLGEAARRVSPGFQGKNPAIDWRALIGQRNVLAHDYGKIDHRRLYDTTTRLMPALLADLDRLLADKE
jgi:uncharacterized protein with HEPN domain